MPEPRIVSHRRLLGPVVGLVKKVVAKCVRWYVLPQTAALEAEVTRLREKVALLERLNVQTQAFALRHYREMFRRLERMEAEEADGVRAA